MNVFENLLARDPAGNIAPGACDFELSEDNLTLKLWVREGLKFHDGTYADITDLEASFKRASAMISRLKKHVNPYLQEEDAVTVEGDKLVLKFSEFDINTMYWLAANQTWTFLMPKEVCEKYGTEGAITDIKDVIGTGPYKLVSFEPSVKVELERFDDYIPVPEGFTGVAGPKKAYMDTLTFIAQNESNSDSLALLAGEIDFLNVDNELIDMIEAGGGVILLSPGKTSTTLMLNTRNPDRPLYDANVRKALAASIDSYALQTFLNFTDSEVTAQFMNPGSPYASKQYVGADYHNDGHANIELAKEYLAKSDYNGEEIILMLSSGSPDIGPIVVDCARKVGLNLKVEYMDSGSYSEFTSDYKNPFDLSYLSLSGGDFAPTLLNAKFIYDLWDNPEKNAALDIMNKTPFGSAESLAAFETFDRVMAEDCPAIVFMRSTNGTFAANKDLVWGMDSGTHFFWWNSYWKNPSEH
jgi:peptide/nickel transport system substrate-binding protein